MARFLHCGHLVDAINVADVGVGAIGEQCIIRRHVRQFNRAGRVPEQIHHRRAAGYEVLARELAQCAASVRIGSYASQPQVQGEAPACGRQVGRQHLPVNVEKIEFLRIDKVLAQQQIGGMRQVAARKNCVVRIESHRFERHGAQSQPIAVDLQVCRLGMHEQQVACGRAQRRFGIDEQA